MTTYKYALTLYMLSSVIKKMHTNVKFMIKLMSIKNELFRWHMFFKYYVFLVYNEYNSSFVTI